MASSETTTSPLLPPQTSTTACIWNPWCLGTLQLLLSSLCTQEPAQPLGCLQLTHASFPLAHGQLSTVRDCCLPERLSHQQRVLRKTLRVQQLHKQL